MSRGFSIPQARIIAVSGGERVSSHCVICKLSRKKLFCSSGFNKSGIIRRNGCILGSAFFGLPLLSDEPRKTVAAGLLLYAKCKKHFVHKTQDSPSDERWLMGNRKWSRVITVSQRERQHDVIEPSAIHRHIHTISCHHRPGYTQVFVMLFMSCFILILSPLHLLSVCPPRPVPFAPLVVRVP